MILKSTGNYHESTRKILRMCWEKTGKVLGKIPEKDWKSDVKVPRRTRKVP